MQDKVSRALSKEGCKLDGEYYCFHHPNAMISKYKVDCDCRKPKPGLLLQAAKERNIDLVKSFFIGDALINVKAGRAAGCKTILVGHFTDFLNRMMQEEDAFPDHMIPSLKEAPQLLRSLESKVIFAKQQK
jgi:D-glycero-D-manno-heptose 1,7-bisphosphate phosphatase